MDQMEKLAVAPPFLPMIPAVLSRILNAWLAFCAVEIVETNTNKNIKTKFLFISTFSFYHLMILDIAISI